MANKYIDLAMNATGPGYKLINLEGGGAPVPPTPPEPTDYSKEYLTIEALENGDFFVRTSVSYSVNEGEWQTATKAKTLVLNAGDKVRFKGTNVGSTLLSGNTKSFKVYGNVESLEYADEFIDKTSIKGSTSPFRYLFNGCRGLKDASNLILPATEGKNSAYREMFLGCSSLEIGPEILASKIGYLACANMFNGCSKLKYIKCLATNIANNSTSNWVTGVATTGTFVKATGANWTTGNNGIPSGWTVIEE